MENQKIDYLLPISIVIAAILIAGAWIYSAGLEKVDSKKDNLKNEEQKPKVVSLENVKSVENSEHIRGNFDATVKIIEFSDMECPFCKSFHNTMTQIINEYGSSGKVAWIYRHYPLEQLHSKAKTSAIASECAAELGGNDAFWKFMDKYIEITPSNDRIDLSQLPEIAQSVGLNKEDFENCLNSGKYNEKIESQIQDAINSGARGTPYSIVIGKNGEKTVIGGAYPYEDVKDIIEKALQ